jgi:hypothetical protein
MLTLNLVSVPHVTGIYTVKGVANQLPDRMRWLHPSAAGMFRAIEDWVVVSDMFRSSDSSLAARRAGRGAMPPGYSAHNYGLAIDLDLTASARNLARLIKRPRVTKGELDEAMASAGWFCHVLEPHDWGAFESWHFNALGIHVHPYGRRSSDDVEDLIVSLYGKQFAPDEIECQAALSLLGMYSGALDGSIGPLTREATRAFQRAWGIAETSRLDERTKRTLAYVASRTV